MANLNQLKVFHAVAQALSFTRAADGLCLTQPGVSRHIKELEEHYGTRLFDRLGKTLALTQAGEILAEATAGIFKLVESAESRIGELNELSRGKLAIGATVPIGTYLLPELFVGFKRRYPGIQIELSVAHRGGVVERVVGNEVELGLVGEGVMGKMLQASTFLRDPLVLVTSPRHPWGAGGASIEPHELTEQPFYIAGRGAGTWICLSEWLDGLGVTLKKVIDVGSTEAVKNAVAAGDGVSMLPRHVLGSEVAGSRLMELDLAGGGPSRAFQVVHHKDRELSAAARAFIALLQDSRHSSVAG
jgi:DNA-binding transcriptional LysR family regulator